MPTPRATAHDHRADLEATLEFINTLELCSTRAHAEYGHTHDALVTADDGVAFLDKLGLAHTEDLRASAGATDAARRAWLERLHAVRAAFREVFDAETEERRATPEAVEVVNDVLRHRPIVELTPGTDGCGVGHRHTGDPTAEALARLAEPLVGAIAGHRTERFRICANEECRYVFVDESRTGKRRWCDMSTCGNRAKVARHRAKAKGETTPLQLLDA